MRRLTLTRTEDTADGVFGRLGEWHTIEEESQGNRPRVSCIPAGTYVCRRTTYHGGGYETFEITDVPGRSRILFHVANTEEDVEGCIGLGLTRGTLNVLDEDTGERTTKQAVLRSRPAFEAFMTALDGEDEFELEISEAYA